MSSPARSSPITFANAVLHETLTTPARWVPALVLLAPALILQVAAPTYLRSRLSPAPWTVAVGSILLVLLAQLAMPVVFALVEAQRSSRVRRLAVADLARLSLHMGGRVFLGLAAGIAPGLWLQVRYAFAASLLTSAHAPTPREALVRSALVTSSWQARLWVVTGAALLLSLVGQGLVAVLNDLLGVISAAGEVNGRTVFTLDYGRHVAAMLLAHVLNAGTLTLHAVAVSALSHEASGLATAAPPPRRAEWSPTLGWRLALAALTVVAVAGLAAVAYKVQQHV